MFFLKNRVEPETKNGVAVIEMENNHMLCVTILRYSSLRLLIISITVLA